MDGRREKLEKRGICRSGWRGKRPARNGKHQKRQPILKEMIEKGEIVLVGGYYDLENGVVRFVK